MSADIEDGIGILNLSSALPSPKEILKQYWGHDSFRPMQEEIISTVMEGKDVLALAAHRGGKSICFQIPTLAAAGICLVISPADCFDERPGGEPEETTYTSPLDT